jgi:hypothetical protein
MEQESIKINHKVVRVFAGKRSGQHAIINWIGAQVDQQILHLNALCVGDHASPVKVMDTGIDFGNSEYFRCPNIRFGDPHGRARLVAYNFEDVPTSFLFNPPLKMPTPDDWPTSNVVVLRDPLNFLASRVKYFRKYDDPSMVSQIGIDIYIDWCEAIISGGLDLIVLNYNRWFLEQSYRREIAALLEIPFTDQGLHSIASSGGGSSFSGLTHDRDTQTLAVLHRYQQVEDDPMYQRILDHYRVAFSRILAELFAELVDYTL